MSQNLSNKTVEELEVLLKEAQGKNWKVFMELPPGLNFNELDERMEPTQKKIGEISRALRMIKPIEFEGEPDADDDVMTLDEFVDNCICGGFIDYDGYGKYVKGDKMSDITINPSDVKNKSLRKDFESIIWFNR